MAYRLLLTEDVPDGVRRVAHEELQGAIAQLEQLGDDPVTAVHEARKSIKKTRALVRLVQPDLPTQVSKRENAALRDAGRLLGGLRDADVMVHAIERLGERYAGKVPKKTFTALAGDLGARRAEPSEAARAAGDAVSALRAIDDRVDEWPLGDVDLKTLRRGTVTSYVRGRRDFAIVHRGPTTERLHEWRKRVKDLWYHQRLLAEVWPTVMEAHAAATKQLSELLGDDHDLAVLAGLLHDDRELTNDPDADTEQVLGLVRARQAELQQEADRLGRLLYTESPKAVSRRVGSWLKTAAKASAAPAT